GPGHLIVQAEHLSYAFAQERAIVRPWPEAPDVHAPKIERWLALDHPFGQILPGPARAGDTDGVEPGGDEQMAQFRGLAEDEIIVRGEAFRAVDKFCELAHLEGRDAMFAVFERLRKFVPRW